MNREDLIKRNEMLNCLVHFHIILLLFRSNVTVPEATICRASGKAMCSTCFTLSARVSSVSSGRTGTLFWQIIAPESTSSSTK